MRKPDEKYSNAGVRAFDTPEFESPEYGSVTIEIRHSEYQSSTFRISRRHAAYLLRDLADILADGEQS